LTQAKKNILFISLDDAVSYWHYRTVFGVALQVPNLDRICAQSTAFHAAYAQAPVCGPSRASFMSGLTPHQTGVFDNSVDVFDVLPAAALWPARLKSAGYFCSSGGKVHHHYKPLGRKDHAALYSDDRKKFLDDMKLKPDAPARKYGGHRGGWATTDPKDDAQYYDHQSASSAIAFLDSYDGDAPFYREVGFYSPHGPHFTPARFKEMYDVGAFQPPPSWAAGFACDAAIPALTQTDDKSRLGDTEFWRACVRNYFSAMSHGDHHLGRVWDALKASRHADTTLVVIGSDHGFHLGERGRFSKFTLFEQVAGVPLILHDPTNPVARVVTDPVALLDLGPTLLSHAGLPVPDAFVGQSLLPCLSGVSDPDRAVMTTWNGGVAIRQGKYRMIRYADGQCQLFDITADYWQQTPLGHDHPAYAAMLDSLISTARRYGYAGSTC
jgi:arylsulfatase A-like enzyme